MSENNDFFDGEVQWKILPKYECTKTVHAMKIKSVEVVTDPEEGAMLIPDDDSCIQVYVDGEYVKKHNPQPGGYFVVYKDGYKSFSPAPAFKAGYVPFAKEREEDCGECDEISPDQEG